MNLQEKITSLAFVRNDINEEIKKANIKGDEGQVLYLSGAYSILNKVIDLLMEED